MLTRLYWDPRAGYARPGHARRRPRPQRVSCGRSATRARRPSCAPAPGGCGTSWAPGTKIYHVERAELRLPPAGERRARPAGDDDPASAPAGFREPTRWDDVPIDTRLGIGMKGSRGPGRRRGPAGGAVRRQREPRLAVRAGPGTTARPTRRTAAPFASLTDLKAALDAENQLELHYQPKVLLGSGTCLSAEALLRWNHPFCRPGVSQRPGVARRDHRACHAADALGDRRRHHPGGALGARRPGDERRGQRLAEESRGA